MGNYRLVSNLPFHLFGVFIFHYFPYEHLIWLVFLLVFVFLLFLFLLFFFSIVAFRRAEMGRPGEFKKPITISAGHTSSNTEEELKHARDDDLILLAAFILEKDTFFNQALLWILLVRGNKKITQLTQRSYQ